MGEKGITYWDQHGRRVSETGSRHIELSEQTTLSELGKAYSLGWNQGFSTGYLESAQITENHSSGTPASDSDRSPDRGEDREATRSTAREKIIEAFRAQWEKGSLCDTYDFYVHVELEDQLDAILAQRSAREAGKKTKEAVADGRKLIINLMKRILMYDNRSKESYDHAPLDEWIMQLDEILRDMSQITPEARATVKAGMEHLLRQAYDHIINSTQWSEQLDAVFDQLLE